MFYNCLVLIRDGTLLHVLGKSVVDLGSLTAGLGQVVLQKRDLVVVAKISQQIFELLVIDVMLFGLDFLPSGWLFPFEYVNIPKDFSIIYLVKGPLHGFHVRIQLPHAGYHAYLPATLCQ